MTASLTSNSDQYDVIWHNDDWGQLWAHLLEPTDDIEACKYAEKWGMDKVVFGNAQGQNTVVPMGQTFSVFFYRTDLVQAQRGAQDAGRVVDVSKKLQAADKVKLGYVGGMAMNHSWFSWFWSMWGNNCDVLMPFYERDNKVLAERLEVEPGRALHARDGRILVGCHQHPQDLAARHAGLRPQRGQRHLHGGRRRLHGGRFAVVGHLHRSGQVEGRGQGRGGALPARAEPPEELRLGRHLGLGDPEVDLAERKALAKEMLAAMMVDEEGQMKLWKATGAPPPNTTFWPKIAAQDPFMKLLKEAVLDSPDKVRGAYYFPQWPAVHKAFNDAVTKAVTGKREDIAKVLAEARRSVWKAAQ